MSTFKLSPMAWNGTIGSPQYQLAYSTVGGLATSQSRSREVLSRLIGERDLIIELNSGLLCTPDKERDGIGQAFRRGMSAQGISVTERSYPNTAKVSFFARILGQSGDSDAFEMRALVPASAWKTGGVDAALTIYGLRYYVLPAGADGAELLQRLNLGTIAPQEVLEAMDLIIFDVPCFGQMGLISTRNDQGALQARLQADGPGGSRGG